MKEKVIKEINDILNNLYEILDYENLITIKNKLTKTYIAYKTIKEMFESEKEKKEIYESN